MQLGPAVAIAAMLFGPVDACDEQVAGRPAPIDVRAGTVGGAGLGDDRRPHDLEILLEPGDGTAEAMIDHIIHLGFEVRVELSLGEGDSTWVQTTRSRAEELELSEGQIVWLRPESESEPVTA